MRIRSIRWKGAATFGDLMAAQTQIRLDGGVPRTCYDFDRPVLTAVERV